ncbi:MAG: ABC1 kinase family protein [Longimicrobiales bacterium]
MRAFFRATRVFLALFPFLVAFLRDRKRWFLLGKPARRSADHHLRRAKRLTGTVASLGPTFIKLAQLLSARADLFPEPYLSAIGTLQDRVPPHDPAEIIAVIDEELGAPANTVFDTLDLEPLAAASLGQVHRATRGGKQLAVKVLRPGVEELVALDLDISFRLLFWLNILFPNHHVQGLTNVVREFSVKVREEMDFRVEAENLARFQENFGDDPGVRTPDVEGDLTRRRLLVMEYVEGTKVDHLDSLFTSGTLRFDDVMESLTGLYLRMMLVDGFLHADPHPGNILVQDDGTLVILDWGMAIQVPRWTRESILGIALAVERENLDQVINEMYKLGMISPSVSRGEIREAATEVMDVLNRARTVPRAQVQELVQEIFDTFYTWPLMLPQELVYFFRAAALLEGIGIRYQPNFDGLGHVRGVIGRMRGEIVRTAAQPAGRAAMDVLADAQGLLRSVRDLLLRAEREEFRVRVHPRDLQAHERLLHLQARRVLLSIFASATALISAILFIAISSVPLLIAGLFAALAMFVVSVFIPTHLLENPLRHARGIRPGDPRT